MYVPDSGVGMLSFADRPLSERFKVAPSSATTSRVGSICPSTSAVCVVTPAAPALTTTVSATSASAAIAPTDCRVLIDLMPSPSFGYRRNDALTTDQRQRLPG